MAQKLTLGQSQSLVMTPRLQQAIKLLQLSNADLAAYIEHEIECNPLLERDEGDTPQRGDVGEASGIDRAEIESSRSSSLDPEDGEPNTAERLGSDSMGSPDQAPLDTNYENHWSSNASLDMPSEGKGVRGDFAPPRYDFEQTIADEKTLREHLREQVDFTVAGKTERAVGIYLIDLLNETGYFTVDPGDVAATLGCKTSLVEDVLDRLRRFDPPGIFARNLADCLGLQLEERGRLDPAMRIFLDHLDLVARRDWVRLSSLCGVGSEDIQDMAEELRALDPKPALAFETPASQSLIPDVLMRPDAQGGWVVELNQDTLPRLLVNNGYHDSLSVKVGPKRDRDYITEHLATANWLIKSLRQRAETILKVASELVRQQNAFFVRGVEHLKPLVLRDIAQSVDMHESTVSRVTANKYMATPRGVFELKYFFTPAIQGLDGGGIHSSESVRHRIRKLIDGEAADAILSDDRLVCLLRESGVDIARRTVAKYRESMNIPSSVQRRRQKADLSSKTTR